MKSTAFKIFFLSMILSLELNAQVLTELDVKNFFEISKSENTSFLRLLSADEQLYKIARLDSNWNVNSKQKNIDLNLVSQYPIIISKNLLYISENQDYAEDKQTIKTHQIKSFKKTSLLKKDSLEIGFCDSILITKSGDVVIVDGFEGGGSDKVTRYSKNLTEIYSFSATDIHKTNYNVIFKENDVFSAYIMDSEKENDIKIRLYESTNNKKLITHKEINLGVDPNVYYAEIANDKIILLINDTSGYSLVALNKELNIINSFDLPMGLSWGQFISSRDKVFFSAGLSVFSYDTNKNKIVWKKIHKSIPPRIVKKGNIATFRGGRVFNLDLNHIIFIEGTYIDGSGVENKVKNCVLKVLNSDTGYVEQKIDLGDFVEEFKVTNNSENLVIYGNNKIKIFKKN